MKAKSVASLASFLTIVLLAGCVSSRSRSLLETIKTDSIVQLSVEELRKERLALFEESKKIDDNYGHVGLESLPSSEVSSFNRDVLVLDVLRLRLDNHVRSRVAQIIKEMRQEENQKESDSRFTFDQLLKELGSMGDGADEQGGGGAR